VKGTPIAEKIEPFSEKDITVIGHPGRNISIQFNSVEFRNYK